MSQDKKGFNLRSFTSFSLVISTLVMSWSGFILYVAPPGRIANWGTWQLMLFTKTEWQALHTIFSYLFFILAIIHLFFVNWKTFLTYIKSKIKSGLNRRWELGGALVLSALIFVGTLRSWVPFGPVMTFGEEVKEGWGQKFETPPVLHMETYTMEQISPLLDSVPASELLSVLKEKGIVIRENDTTLKQIAEANHKVPADIYNILADRYKKAQAPVGGEVPQGYGKFTVKMLSDKTGKGLDEIKSTLMEKGIEVTDDMTLRAIADKLGVTPKEVYGYFGETTE